jgi:hypothetical protein
MILYFRFAGISLYPCIHNPFWKICLNFWFRNTAMQKGRFLVYWCIPIEISMIDLQKCALNSLYCIPIILILKKEM